MSKQEGKSVAFQLYPDKAIAGTASLSSDAFKAYWLVLWWMWLHSANHYTMSDTDAAWRRATLGIFAPDALQRIRAEIMPEDAPMLERKGNLLLSNGLRKEALKQEDYREEQRRKSKIRWDKEKERKRGDTRGSAEGEPGVSSPSTTPSPSPTTATPKKHHVEIVDYLNEVLGTKYRATGQKTISKINARMNEGYGVDHFKTVIDHKFKEWANTDMAKYLRPETLFGTKFEGYLQDAERTKGKDKDEDNWKPPPIDEENIPW